MAKLRRPELQHAPGPDVLGEHEGPEPDRADVDAYARWRHVRAARLRREQERRGDARYALLPPMKPSAALTYYVMTGTWSTAERLAGWVEAAQLGANTLAIVAGYWYQHADALRTEAAAAGFTPWMATKRAPAGPGFERWRADFLERHTY